MKSQVWKTSCFWNFTTRFFQNLFETYNASLSWELTIFVKKKLCYNQMWCTELSSGTKVWSILFFSSIISGWKSSWTIPIQVLVSTIGRTFQERTETSEFKKTLPILKVHLIYYSRLDWRSRNSSSHSLFDFLQALSNKSFIQFILRTFVSLEVTALECSCTFCFTAGNSSCTSTLPLLKKVFSKLN